MNLKIGLKEFMIDNLQNNKFTIIYKSLFDVPSEALTNSINCVSTMGAGIALEFKKRYPDMFNDYKIKCFSGKIKPGDCYVYIDKPTGIYILGLAVKGDWKYWSSKEYIKMCLKSLKLTLLENDIKSVNIPLIGGSNGRRGPNGKIPGMEPPPEKEELKEFLREELEPFSNKFNISIRLCIPDGAPKKPELDLTQFFSI
jgi:hypothetical protein